MGEPAKAYDAQGLYLTEAEIARRLGISEDRWRETRRVLEREGLPSRDPLFSNKRFWPAVQTFLMRRYGMSGSTVHSPDGEWNLDAL